MGVGEMRMATTGLPVASMMSQCLGHRMGTAEFESALVMDPGVAEAAVVGYPHPIKDRGSHLSCENVG